VGGFLAQRVQVFDKNMTPERVKALKGIGFVWNESSRSYTSWVDSLSELADYCKIKGHCNVPKN
jgi:hypothetical protein